MNFIKKLKAVRGAVSCENTENSITTSVVQLYTEILKQNRIHEKEIVSIQFTSTKDLNVINPAKALRKYGFAKNIALFCCTEPHFENSMSKCIRILVYYYGRRKTTHIYLGETKKLRPDLCH